MFILKRLVIGFIESRVEKQVTFCRCSLMLTIDLAQPPVAYLIEFFEGELKLRLFYVFVR